MTNCGFSGCCPAVMSEDKPQPMQDQPYLLLRFMKYPDTGAAQGGPSASGRLEAA